MENEDRVSKRPAFRPSHPGAILRDTILPALGMPKTKFAEHIGLSRQSLYTILNEERGITADVAARLARAFGNDARFWLNLQSNHDAWKAERDSEVLQIERLKTPFEFRIAAFSVRR